MEDILRLELETADKRLTVLESTIKIQDRIIKSMEERIEQMKSFHKAELRNVQKTQSYE